MCACYEFSLNRQFALSRSKLLGRLKEGGVILLSVPVVDKNQVLETM